MNTHMNTNTADFTPQSLVSMDGEKAVDSLECSPKFNVRNFAPSSYINEVASPSPSPVEEVWGDVCRQKS